jgi:multimeric flavodoxin WrbA
MIMENLSTNIRNMTNQWKKMFDDEFFACLNNGYGPITNFGAPTDANSSSLAACYTPQQPCIQPCRCRPSLQRPHHQACG